MTDQAERIAELKRLAEAATPGPWESVPVLLAGSNGNMSWGESTGRLINGPPQTIEHETQSARWFTRKEDGDFMAAANPQAILSLIEHVESVERQLADEKIVADRIRRIDAIREKRNTHRLGIPCCCEFDDDGETILGMCSVHAETIRKLERENAELRKALGAKQAQIDSLMLEYCPDEMTQEQMGEWERHQRQATTPNQSDTAGEEG